MDPTLSAGVDDDNDNDTPLAGVQGNDTPLAGVSIPITTNDDDDTSDAESDHNSIDPNEANDNSSKASVHLNRSHTSVHNMMDEPPQLPHHEEELDNTQLPELETKVSILCRSAECETRPMP